MIKPKLLGWVVIAYGAFNSGALLDLLRVFVVQDFESGLSIVLGNVIWASFLLGGIALVLHKRWSKWLVLFSAAVSLIVMVATVAPIVAKGLDNTLIPALIATGVGVIPVLLIFSGALLVKIVPADLAAENTRAQVAPTASAKRTKIDIAHACFLWIALVVFVFLAIEIVGKKMMTVSDVTAAGIGFFILIPLSFAAMTAGLVGIIFSLVIWRDWRLHVLSALTIFLPFMFLAYDDSKLIGGRTLIGVAALYVIASILFTTRWFAFVRKRLE